VTYIGPDQFVPLTTFYIWMAVIIAGVGRVSGAISERSADRHARGSRFLRRPHSGYPDAKMASVRIGVVGLLLIIS